MHSELHLTEIALVVVAALAGGLALVRLKQPPILGYILAGIILGPSGLGLVESREFVSTLAELGVLLLLFVVGMELNLRTFKKAWVITTLCTTLQIATALTITFLLAPLFGWSVGMSLLFGFVMSLSSTAVVVNMLENINEYRTEAGQYAIGVLIAQDLAIVPMILILRNLGKSVFDHGLIMKLVLSISLIIVLIAYLSRKQRVRIPLTQMISGIKELTPLACLTFCFAAAAISGLIGLSAAYGAFLAGLVLGNTHERLILLETTQPIQSTLLMVFFLSIGLLLDIHFIIDHWGMVLVLLFVITIVKTALNIGILHLLRLPWSQSFLIGVVLAQLGEFAFLLATVGYETKIIDSYGQKLIIALTVLSLAFSPVWLSIARRLKLRATNGHPGLFRLIILSIGGGESGWYSRLKTKTKKPIPVTIDEEDS
ncbi:cation:proton antiporter [Candidatus Paracaedibacter symbiosus]|uniref:cation:proton antiporter n=1 Tax=Candidatus Paracaedibacter symbiosus TaxID=244582 RepID=UPI00068A1D20|nr:cation:proton antiporter [Candidatus Paracaedibacter symbiosus]